MTFVIDIGVIVAMELAKIPGTTGENLMWFGLYVCCQFPDSFQGIRYDTHCEHKKTPAPYIQKYK